MTVTKPNTTSVPQSGPSHGPTAKRPGAPRGSNRLAAAESVWAPVADAEWEKFLASASLPGPPSDDFRSVEPDSLLRIEEVCVLLKFKSRQSIYNRLKEGGRYWDPKFPKQAHLGGSPARPSSARWHASAIYRYIAMLGAHSK
jgi:predicted DNA-binding transcriptional regulator AlpA